MFCIVPQPACLTDDTGPSPTRSARAHELIVEHYGRSVKVQGLGPVSSVCVLLHWATRLNYSEKWDQRLLTFDPAALNHVARNPNIYEKPWQTQRFITSMIGCGLLSAEGIVHKRQRRVATPAFSIQNLRAFAPIVFERGYRLRNRWRNIINKGGGDEAMLDVCMWANRTAFDVVGAAGPCTVFLITNLKLMASQALTTILTRLRMIQTSYSAHTGRCLNSPSRSITTRCDNCLGSISQS